MTRIVVDSEGGISWSDMMDWTIEEMWAQYIRLVKSHGNDWDFDRWEMVEKPPQAPAPS